MIIETDINHILPSGHISVLTHQLSTLNRRFLGFKFRAGVLIVKNGRCVPVVDGKTDLVRFTDGLPRKSRHLLEVPPMPTGELRDTLVVPGSQLYYHFMINHLPTLLFLRNSAGTPPYLITAMGPNPDSVAGLIENILAALFPETMINRRLCDDGVYAMSTVVMAINRDHVVATHFHRTVTLPVLYQSATRLFADRGPIKLFVRRTAERRRMANQCDIESWYVARGFVAIDPGAMSVAEQAAWFSRATHIVGVEGGGMTNLVFAVSARMVVVLCSVLTANDQFFRDLVEPLGVAYHMVAGEPLDSATRRRDSDFSISLLRIEALHRSSPELALT